MIYPKSEITRMWYQIDVASTMVLESYTSKPIGVTTQCPSRVWDPEKKTYGATKTDDQLAQIFPYIKVTYITLKRAKDDSGNLLYWEGKQIVPNSTDNEGNPLEPCYDIYCEKTNDDKKEYKYIRESNSEHKAIVTTDNEGFDVSYTVKYLWLDNMISDGDEVTVNDGVIIVDNVKEITNFKKGCPDGNCDEINTYETVWRNSLIDSVCDDITGGISYETAIMNEPWYVKSAVQSNGNVYIKVIASTFGNESSLLDAFNITNDDFVTGIIDRLNRQVVNYRDALYERVVSVSEELKIKVYKTGDMVAFSDSSTPSNAAANTGSDPVNGDPTYGGGSSADNSGTGHTQINP